jgi:hypothetical protein
VTKGVSSVRIRSLLLGTAVLLVTTACGNSAPPAAPTSTSSKVTMPAASQSPTSAAPAGKDPSTTIEGIEIHPYASRDHIQAPRRVAYDQAPPFGGNHDYIWATCNGVVYTKAVRNEHMVHALEHGAVWIAYNPEQVTGDALAKLAQKVTNQPYTLMSPYPGLDKPVSLQSWGHRLKLTDPADPRVDQFIKALRQNSYTFPEPGATCDPTGVFDETNPPPFDPTPPGAGAVPVGS